jgi:hypothetical protein
MATAKATVDDRGHEVMRLRYCGGRQEGEPDAVRDEGGPMSYDDLDGAAKGDQAAMALLEYMRPETTRERRDEIRGRMLRYCGLDTMAMVEVLRGIRAECERLFGT